MPCRRPSHRPNLRTRRRLAAKGSVSLSFTVPHSTSTPFRATGRNGKINTFLRSIICGTTSP
ncbi:hypothetical protein B0H12DRAFT_1156283 [Mycena haematopus]|nr:hypothetical protein B0H12DRAFT_1172352 [Mycena haematopus]KAJ7212828.1 hypothetical protein B0H12DRAFT_1156283 [Mycena haematopus]